MEKKPLTVSQLKPSSFPIESLSHYSSHLSLQHNVTDTITKQHGSINTNPILRHAVYLEKSTLAEDVQKETQDGNESSHVVMEVNVHISLLIVWLRARDLDDGRGRWIA